MNQQEYVAHRGCRCPSCGSSTGISGGSIEVDAGTASQSINCSECGATWSDTYVLTGFSDLDGGFHSEVGGPTVERNETDATLNLSHRQD